MKRGTAPWVRKAEDDLGSARLLARKKPPFRDQVCFHCQQAAEKYFKATLFELGLAIPKTHNLDNLLNQLTGHDASLRSLRRGLRSLTQFAVDYRYPSDRATLRQMRLALQRAEKVRDVMRQRLGLSGR